LSVEVRHPCEPVQTDVGRDRRARCPDRLRRTSRSADHHSAQDPCPGRYVTGSGDADNTHRDRYVAGRRNADNTHRDRVDQRAGRSVHSAHARRRQRRHRQDNTSIKDDGFGQCMWNTTEVGNTGDLIYGALQAQQLSFIKSSFGTGGVDTTVSGHPAFWNPTEGLDSLWVDVGNGHLLVLSFPRSGELDPSYKAIAEALAATAIGNL
jgi:hypothetical protein